jgi:hypothetical protein
VTVNLHHSSTDIEVHRDAVYWGYSSADGYYNGTVSFFISDPLELKKIFNFDPDQLRPEHIRVRANHPSGFWPGGERTGENNDRAGWFRLSFLSALAAAGPLVWVILRIRDRSRRLDAKPRRRVAGKVRWLCSGLSLAACLLVAAFWIASSRGYHASLGWVWLLSTGPEQDAITLLATAEPGDRIMADLWGNWYWVEPNYRGINRGVAGFHYVRLMPERKKSLFDSEDASNTPALAGPRGFSLTMPDWFLCAITALLPACETVAWMRRRSTARYRVRHGLCGRCGYDLRATQERCPECGGKC